MADEHSDAPALGARRIAQRSAGSLALVVIFGALGIASLTWLSLAGCLAMADGGGYDLTPKASNWCNEVGGTSVLSALGLYGPFVLCFLLAQRAVWRGRGATVIGLWTGGALVPGFVYAVVLRTAALQFLIPTS